MLAEPSALIATLYCSGNPIGTNASRVHLQTFLMAWKVSLLFGEAFSTDD